ncbi:hypothetical protein [Thermodesulfobacterium thermophilum]|uniref:hypothetical protein n=1 Tax=Thermodesulfobacterium thermophilum TaxID=886 RepID=UPI001B7F83A4|nr:hypothetical protein [Thermodesulfobacterium thermophilum]
MNWWLDLGMVYCYELNQSGNLSDPEIPTRLFKVASNIVDRIGEKRNPYLSIINTTLLNNYIANPKNKSKRQSEEDIKSLFSTKPEPAEINCSFCGQMTTKNKDSIAGRKWIVSGGWEGSPLYAGGGYIAPRICLNCRRLSLLAAFKAYELFVKEKLPFIIYNPDIQLYKKLLDNLLLRKDLNLNFERSSSIFLSLGSLLVYPNFDRRGNIESFDLRPLLPKASLMLMNLSGLLRTKGKEQYILEIVEKYRDKAGAKLVSDFLMKQSKLSSDEVVIAFYAFVKAYKGGIGMTKEFFDLGKKLGNELGDKAYSSALKLYKSLKDPTQLQKQVIGIYIYLKQPIPPELTKITENDEYALAFIMGIMNTIKG